MRRPTHSFHAFSLVELSIVLVILGLLAGGILAGKALIRASELRAVTREYAAYRGAVHAFRDKYFALPGDMANAQSFWGVASNCTTDGATIASGTCNAVVNDGIIGYTSASGGSNSGREQFYAWHHLVLAGLVEGSYSGLRPTTPSNPVAGTNVPASKISGGGWMLGIVNSQNSTLWLKDWSQALVIGNANGIDSYLDYDANLFFPEEAWNIDTKMDDGLPAMGMVVNGASRNCTDAWTNTAKLDAIYVLTGVTSRTKLCSLAFLK